MKYHYNPHAGRSDLPGQLEISGTSERMAQLAQLKSAAPMRATKEQKPCDHGLFSDDANQLDLLK